MKRREFLRRLMGLAGSTAFLPLVMVGPKQQAVRPVACDGVEVVSGGQVYHALVVRADDGEVLALPSSGTRITLYLDG
jgi:hypothetical protein